LKENIYKSTHGLNLIDTHRTWSTFFVAPGKTFELSNQVDFPIRNQKKHI